MKLFNLTETGLEEAQIKPSLPLYSRVYGYGIGMGQDTYAVITESDKTGRQELVSMHSPDSSKQTIDKYSKPLSKKFGIGMYWDDKEPDFRFNKDEVEKAMEAQKTAIAERKQKEAERAAQDKAEIAALPNQFPFLTPITDSYNNTQMKKNLTAHLKHDFPGIKFSIRKEGYDSYHVRWVNGPTEEQIQVITRQYKDHTTDFTGDFRDYSPSTFNKVFGGVNFIFTYREQSEEVKALLPDLQKLNHELEVEDTKARQLLHTIFCNTPIPIGATNLKISKTDVQAGSLEDFYKITFNAPDPVKVNPVAVITDGKIELIDYSPKAIAIIGETKPLKDTLKALGGRFNFRLKCGAGWIFPKSKAEEVKEALNL